MNEHKSSAGSQLKEHKQSIRYKIGSKERERDEWNCLAVNHRIRLVSSGWSCSSAQADLELKRSLLKSKTNALRRTLTHTHLDVSGPHNLNLVNNLTRDRNCLASKSKERERDRMGECDTS